MWRSLLESVALQCELSLITAYNDFLARRAVFLLWDVSNNDSYVIRAMAWRKNSFLKTMA